MQKHKIARLDTIVANDNAYIDGAYLTRKISIRNYLLVGVISSVINI